MPIQVKDKFTRIQRQYAGRILIQSYGEAGSGKSLAFTPLVMDVASGMRCECGHAGYNATNFGNAIHFCPNRVYEFTVTDYFAHT